MPTRKPELINLISIVFEDEPDLVLQCVDLIRRKLLGVIVVDNPDKPHLYWSDDGRTLPLNDESFAETPRCFTSFARAVKTATKLRQQYGGSWGLLLWMHPDVHTLPLRKYEQLRAKFSGRK